MTKAARNRVADALAIVASNWDDITLWDLELFGNDTWNPHTETYIASVAVCEAQQNRTGNPFGGCSASDYAEAEAMIRCGWDAIP